VFSVDEATGRFASIGWQASGGRIPRFFAFSPAEDVLFLANEDSDEIVSFRIDQRISSLKPAGTMARTGSPVCMVFNLAIHA
jgi:6-phosphogluconolactonase (cycloisomerase 2 family)